MPFALLYAQPALFLLPDQHSRFVHGLVQTLKEGPESLLIITPTFRHAEVKKAILKGAQEGSHITLVVQHLVGDPLSMAQYQNIDLYTYTARPLRESVILIDNRLVCTLPGGIDAEQLGQNASLIRCSDDPSETAVYRSALLPLLKRSHKYLK